MTDKESNNLKKEYLFRYRELCGVSQAISYRIKALTESIEAAKTQQITGMPTAHAMKDLSDYVVKLEALQEQAWDNLTARLKMQVEIETAINRLEPTESAVMYSRYIMLKSWDDIADMMGYTKRHTLRIHGSALQKLKMSLDVT